MVQLAPLLVPAPVTSLVRFMAEDIVPAVASLVGQPAQADLTSVANFLGQIPGVLNQVIEGVSEFTPTPVENRETVACSYTIPSTLLVSKHAASCTHDSGFHREYKHSGKCGVKCTVDSIDESDILEELLQPRIQSIGGKLHTIILTGTHAYDHSHCNSSGSSRCNNIGFLFI